MINVLRFFIATGYTIAAGLLAFGLLQNRPVPIKRPIWYIGLGICAAWAAFYWTTALFPIAKNTRIVWSQTIQLMTLAHIGVVLFTTKR